VQSFQATVCVKEAAHKGKYSYSRKYDITILHDNQQDDSDCFTDVSFKDVPE